MAILDKILAAAMGIFRRKKPRRPRRAKVKPKKTGIKRGAARRRKPAAKPVKKQRSKKKPVRKVLKKKVLPAKMAVPEEKIGTVTHFFSRIQVVVLKLDKDLKVGERIRIKGPTSDFVQPVKSLQIESVDVKSAKKGDLVGLKVGKIAREGDAAYRLK